MSSSMVDKENSNGHIHVGGSRKFGDPLHGNGSLFKANHLSTPQHKLKSNIFNEMKSKTIQKSVNGNEKRRALGDLLNTSKANRQLAPSFGTPKIKTDLSLKYGTPKNTSMKKLSNDFEKQTLSSTHIKYDQADQENYPPVEKCIKQIDTFNDLFEDGKLSDIFLNKKVTYVPRLPSGGPKLPKNDDVFHEITIYSDKKWNKKMREDNRTFKKEQKKENLNFLEFQELPELPELEDANNIVDDFEIDCDDSF